MLFIGTILIASMIFLCFLSGLRFQMEMGLLLAIWMFISMVVGANPDSEHGGHHPAQVHSTGGDQCVMPNPAMPEALTDKF